MASRENGPGLSPQEIKEKCDLNAQLDRYLARRFSSYRKSILKDSLVVPRNPHEHGKDSHVYFHGSLDEFLNRPDTPRYVTKYSVPEREVSPDNIEYLVKKYRILKMLLGEYIPRSWFVLGEFRKGLPKYELGTFHTILRAVTIQREIRGKTFAEMTQKERERPVVQEALQEAMKRYLTARKLLRQACRNMEVNPKVFELQLDIGKASPGSPDGRFEPLTYSSPNVMYDERKKKVYFIDMGWGVWTPDKETVYEHLIEMLRPGAAPEDLVG